MQTASTAKDVRDGGRIQAKLVNSLDNARKCNLQQAIIMIKVWSNKLAEEKGKLDKSSRQREEEQESDWGAKLKVKSREKSTGKVSRRSMKQMGPGSMRKRKQGREGTKSGARSGGEVQRAGPSNLHDETMRRHPGWALKQGLPQRNSRWRS